MKTTQNLYRCDAKEWANMSYKEALEFRIHLAELAMLHYKSTADAIKEKLHSVEYYELVAKFRDSEKAVEWNKIMLGEIT